MVFTNTDWLQDFPHSEQAQVVQLIQRAFEDAGGNDTTTLTALAIQTILENAAGIEANLDNP